MTAIPRVGEYVYIERSSDKIAAGVYKVKGVTHLIDDGEVVVYIDYSHGYPMAPSG